MSTFADYLGPDLASTLRQPNHVNPETEVPTILGTEISLTAVMIMFVVMRFYSRLHVKHMWGADDTVMGVAAALSVAHTMTTCLGTRHGLGYHLADIQPTMIPLGFKWTLTSIIQFHPVSGLTKVSVCIGYLRLFPGNSNLWFCWAMIVYCALWGVGSTLAILFQCT